MPDIALLKQMSIDFNIAIDDILEGKIISKNLPQKSHWHGRILLAILFILLGILALLYLKKDASFEFKTLSSNCNHFNISGSIAYNNAKSSIYISNIQYCGGDDTTNYEKIECSLYESHSNTETKIGQYDYKGKETITLEAFLKNVTFAIDDYIKKCKEYTENSLYLRINATDTIQTITYKVPLVFNNSCLNK